MLTLCSMLAAHNASFIANSVASITTQLTSQQAENVRAVRNLENMGSQLEEHINVVGDTLQSASNNTIPRPVMSALKSTIRSCARETFKESLEKHYTELQESQDKAQKTRRQPSVQEEEEWDHFEPSIPQRVSTAMSLFSVDGDEETLVDDESKTADTGPNTNDNALKHCDHVVIHKEYDTIFGRLEVVVKAVFASSADESAVEGTMTSMRAFQVILSFRPSSWLSIPALWRVTAQRNTSNCRNNIHIIPTFSPIVAHTSPIFQACQEGKLLEVKGMLARRQASIHDIDEWGRGLMHVCPSPPFETLASSHGIPRWQQDQGISHSSPT